jgi:hypothetical protein
VCRNSHLKWDPPDPAGTMFKAKDVPGWVSAGPSPLAGLELRPGVYLALEPSACMDPGCAGPHLIPDPGTPRVCHPKGRTTARAGGHWADKAPRQALEQPGS